MYRPRSFTSIFTSGLTFALAGMLACGPKGDTAPPDDPGAAAADSDEGDEQAAKAREAAEKRARLQALPPLPGVEKPRPVKFPEPTITTLDNGLRVVVLEDHEIPVVRATLAIRAGDIHAPADKPTLASMVATLLTEGTKKKSKAKIDEAMDATGGSMNAGTSDEMAILSATVLTKDLKVALPLMAEEAMSPAFPEEAIKKLTKQTVQGIRTQKVQPMALAQKMAARVVYGTDSAYGRAFPSDEQIESVTRDDVQKFFDRHYVASNSILLLTGDIDPDTGKKLASKYLGKWTAGEKVAVPRAEPLPPPTAPVVHIVDRKASAQAFVSVVFPAPKVGEKGWIELEVLKNVLAGGTMSTRLNFVLREQLGLTYGASASYSFGHDGGLLGGGGGTKSKTGGEFAEALLLLFVDLGKEPLPENDLRRVKDFVSGRFALEAEGVDVLANKTMTKLMFELPDDFWTRYRSDVEAVTPEQLKAVAAEYLAPERAQIIAVGKRKKLEKQLAGMGEIRVYDADLNPVK